MKTSQRNFFFEAIRPSFRGEIWENAAGVPMGAGYANNEKPFDIESACYLKPVFRAIRNPAVRKVVIRACVQGLKTFTVEESMAFFAQHFPGEMALYDCDIEAAADHAKSRTMRRFKSIPGFAEIIATILNRFDLTTTEIYLPGMTLRLWPLNESAVQRITLQYVFICDGFLSKKTGLIKQAIARTTQHPADKKIIIESQGAEMGDDFTAEWEDTNQQVLHVICPLCGKGQPFDWERSRPKDFPIEKLREKFCGMQRGPEELVKLPDGEYNEPAILEHTHYECFHCGGRWDDKPSVRAALDRSSYYVPTNPNALPENVGFSWPLWINRRNPWGKDCMLPYLKAVRADKERGNREPLKQWFQKVAGVTWRDDVGVFTARISDSVYDINKPMDNQERIFGVIDCQEDLTHFWAQVWAVDKYAGVRLLERAHLKSKKEVEALMQKWKVPLNCVGIDGRHKTNEVIQWASENRYIGPVQTAAGKRISEGVMTWRVLMGSEKPSFRWPNGQVKRYDYGFKGVGNRYAVRIGHKGRPFVIYVLQTNWSNLAVKDIAKRYRDRDSAPKMEVLPDTEKGPESFTEQMFSEYRTTEKGKPIWKKRTGKVHNHDWDNFCQLLVMMDLFSMLTFEGPSEAET